MSEAFCNQKDAGGLEQRLNAEAEPVIAQGETLVLEQSRVAALHWPAPLSQSRSVWLPTPVDLRLDPEVAAQFAMRLGVVALIGEHGPEAGHHRKGGQEQALENERIVDMGRGRHTCDWESFKRA